MGSYTQWWRCADGSLVNLWYVAGVTKRDPIDPVTGEPNADPGISFLLHREKGWLDTYPTALDRDIAYARLLEYVGVAPTV